VNPPSPGGETDILRVLHVIGERRWVMVAAIVFGIAAFAVWAPRQPKIYEASATIIVETQPPQVFGGEVKDVVQMGPGQFYGMQDYLQTQRRVLISDSLIRRVIDRLKLQSDTAFWGGAPPTSATDAVEEFSGALSAEPVLDTQIIAVTFVHGDPAQAKRAVDGVVDAYIENNVEQRDIWNVSASKWLAVEGDDLRRRLTEAELALYEFKQKNDLLSVSLEDRINNTSREIDRLTDALTDVRLRKVARAAEADELEKMAKGDSGAVSPAQGDSTSTVRNQLNDEERRLSELKERYQDTHPLVRQQAAKVGAVQAALRREIQLQLRGAQARTNEAVEQEKKIAGQLEKAKQEGLRITRLELEYNKLKREADALSKQYQMVQNRTKETELASKIKSNNLHVLDYARLPKTPKSPRLRRAAVLFGLVSLLAGLVLAFILDALDRSLKTPEDVESKLALPFLGMVPHVAGELRARMVADQPTSLVAESCRLIRTNLLFAGLTRPLNRLLVTSSVAREGKTLTTLNLGIIMAQAGQKVLIIDGDLRKSSIRAALQIENQVGLTDVLLGTVPLERAVQPTGIPNLSVLCAGPAPPNPAELVDGPRFRQLIDECAERFERVLVDSPPALPLTDPGILARHCDGVVFVVRSRRTRFDQALRASRTLSDLGARVLGVVLNDCEGKRRGYGEYEYGMREGGGAGVGARRA
jgi:capsular exopolysaccharide synthesis family protein